MHYPIFMCSKRLYLEIHVFLLDSKQEYKVVVFFSFLNTVEGRFN